MNNNRQNRNEKCEKFVNNCNEIINLENEIDNLDSIKSYRRFAFFKSIMKTSFKGLINLGPFTLTFSALLIATPFSLYTLLESLLGAASISMISLLVNMLIETWTSMEIVFNFNIKELKNKFRKLNYIKKEIRQNKMELKLLKGNIYSDILTEEEENEFKSAIRNEIININDNNYKDVKKVSSNYKYDLNNLKYLKTLYLSMKEENNRNLKMKEKVKKIGKR